MIYMNKYFNWLFGIKLRYRHFKSTNFKHSAVVVIKIIFYFKQSKEKVYWYGTGFESVFRFYAAWIRIHIKRIRSRNTGCLGCHNFFKFTVYFSNIFVVNFLRSSNAGLPSASNATLGPSWRWRLYPTKTLKDVLYMQMLFNFQCNNINA